MKGARGAANCPGFFSGVRVCPISFNRQLFLFDRKSHEFDFGIYYVILKLFYHHKMAREVMPFTEIVREVKVLKQE